MKSLTIHNIENEIAEAIEKMADATGLSQNKVVKKLLRKALELEAPEKPKRDLSRFAGAWTEEEAAAFEKSLKVFEKTDEELWT
ncbi:MAG: ribbon-helix-helix protein, CopG family [Saprospiraceae bacterium]|nr:ribbon-helix-helix protein, CopG family [Saprospiraceae bacterium]MDZ4705146.1 ribbon-helix-helix protein, CopG family [Saprospiraceae bacterium]